MEKAKKKRKIRRILKWLLWALITQVVLINISAALYADKLSHLHPAGSRAENKPAPNNLFGKTWRLFTGLKMYRVSLFNQEVPFPHSPVRLRTSDKQLIEAVYSRIDSNARGTVILFHGLTGQKEQVLHEAAQFRAFGYNVMLVDTRAHGKSSGEVVTMGYRESEEVKLAFDYVKARGEKNIFLWGASMGAVMVIKAVADYDLAPAGLIAEQPFLSLQSHLDGRARMLGFPGEPFAFLTSFWMGVEHGFNGWRFRTSRYAKKLKCPVLLQRGGRDQLVMPYETDKIYAAIGSAYKRMVTYEHAYHDLLLKQDRVTWQKEVGEFLARFNPSTF